MYFNKKQEIAQIIDTDLDGIINLSLTYFFNKELSFYIFTLKYYLQGDIQSLKEHTLNFDSSCSYSESSFFSLREIELIKDLSLLRLQIREHKIEEQLINKLLDNEFELWNGEIKFVVGLAYLTLKNYSMAQTFFAQAIEPLNQLGAFRKSLKSRANALAAESCRFPDRNYLVDNHQIFRKAKKLREFSVAGTALINSAREYQKMGAHLISLKYINKALAILDREKRSLNYFYAFLHRAHLHLDLFHFGEAQMDIDFLRTSHFPEIKEALKVLENRYLSQNNEINEKKLCATWNERWNSSQYESDSLSETESRLLSLISQRSLPKFEIIKILYGEKLDSYTLENRFKAMMGRLRKKRPHLIIFRDGLYSISDEIYITQKVIS